MTAEINFDLTNMSKPNVVQAIRAVSRLCEMMEAGLVIRVRTSNGVEFTAGPGDVLPPETAADEPTP